MFEGTQLAVMKLSNGYTMRHLVGSHEEIKSVTNLGDVVDYLRVAFQEAFVLKEVQNVVAGAANTESILRRRISELEESLTRVQRKLDRSKKKKSRSR